MNRLIGNYQNGNYDVLIYEDGTKIRETEDDEFTASFPECMDVKITNYCDRGCPYCHEDSNKQGLHGDILNPKFINTLHPYTELACLKGDTIVYGASGAMEISDLKIGDKIFDSEHKLRTLRSINKTNKESITLVGKKGFNATCSKDHPFMVDNIEVGANCLNGKSIDVIENINNSDNEYKTIDMSKFIKESNHKLISSRGGALLDDNMVRLRNNTKEIPRYIELNNEIMWLYGLFIAEGSAKGLALNINEIDFVIKVKKIWKEYFNNDCRIYTNEEKHSLNIELQSKTLIEDLFINEFRVGKGARNKSIGYLFNINNKELIRQSLLGLFDGDGCYRIKTDKKGRISYNISLKTTSKKLVYEVQYLLAKWFEVYSSVHYGVSKERHIEGRKLEKSDYYSLNIYNRDDINKVFFDRFDMTEPLQKQSKNKKNIFKITEIINTNKVEMLYDITLDGGTHTFPINGYYLTHNCGGGNPLSHPDLEEFLILLRSKRIIANVTINQKHFVDNYDYVKSLCDRKLIHGLGVSFTNANDDFIDKILSTKNVVLHVINGVVNLDELSKLANKGIKVLILGYKQFRKGIDYYSQSVEDGKSRMYESLSDITKQFTVVSFDNLALKQLNVKRLMSDKDWNEFFMGDDGQFTMYMDLVEQKFARNSTSEVRYDLLDNVINMFKEVK